MWLSKLKLAAAVMVLVVAVCGAGAGVYVAAGGAARASLAPLGDGAAAAAVQPPTKEEKEKAEKIVRDALGGLDVSAVNLLEDKDLLRTFPNHLFFDVRHRYEYGVPLGKIEGSMLWAVTRKDPKAFRLGSEGGGGGGKIQLPKQPERGGPARPEPVNEDKPAPAASPVQRFIEDSIAVLPDDAALQGAVRACLRVAVEASTDRRWLTLAIQDDSIKVAAAQGGKTATGKAIVKSGGAGDIAVTLHVANTGKVGKVELTNQIRMGPRPICQATKLLDADPVVRAMAEEQLLLLGEHGADYLAQRRTEATSAELRQAIDAIAGRIHTREQPARLTPPAAAHLDHPDRIVRGMARQQQRLRAE